MRAICVDLRPRFADFVDLHVLQRKAARCAPDARLADKASKRACDISLTVGQWKQRHCRIDGRARYAAGAEKAELGNSGLFEDRLQRRDKADTGIGVHHRRNRHSAHVHPHQIAQMTARKAKARNPGRDAFNDKRMAQGCFDPAWIDIRTGWNGGAVTLLGPLRLDLCDDRMTRWAARMSLAHLASFLTVGERDNI